MLSRRQVKLHCLHVREHLVCLMLSQIVLLPFDVPDDVAGSESLVSICSAMRAYTAINEVPTNKALKINLVEEHILSCKNRHTRLPAFDTLKEKEDFEMQLIL
jgi:hypothetical protein